MIEESIFLVKSCNGGMLSRLLALQCGENMVYFPQIYTEGDGAKWTTPLRKSAR